MSEEDFDVGRKIGLVARSNRELYEHVKSIAKQKKLKMSEVITDALELWTMYNTLNEIDPRSLVVAMNLVERMLDRSVKLLVQLGNVFTSEFVKTTLELALSSYPQQKEQVSQEQKNESKQLLSQVMYPLLVNLLNTLVSIITPQYQHQQYKMLDKTIKVEE